MANFIAPTGYVELDDDCQYSIDRKSTRGRESVNPDDVAFYFSTYLVPKYGLQNINVSNVASFMKDLEMNWTKLTPDLKNNVLDIMVDNILPSGNYDFKTSLLAKLGIQEQVVAPPVGVSKFGQMSSNVFMDNWYLILFAIVVLYFIFNKN